MAWIMEIRKGNIARGHVIWRRIRKEVRIVNDFEKYLNTLALLTSMRNKDMISDRICSLLFKTHALDINSKIKTFI